MIMIQRVQTIWLSICLVLSLVLLKGNIISFMSSTQDSVSLGISGLKIANAGGHETLTNNYVVSAILILIPIFSLSAIFMFRFRQVQKLITMIAGSLALILILFDLYAWLSIARKYNAVLTPDYRTILPLIILISAIMAWFGINKDEKIVKSYDRLR